ncbi:MAG: hypothetical protein Q9162_002019 [Coniocarpon cinnabarinum]
MSQNGTVPGTSNRSMASLTASLHQLGIKSLPSFANACPVHNPVDVYRAHIASVVASIAGVKPEIVYPALQWTSTLDKGDLTLPVPALRLKGQKPDELARTIANNFPEDILVEKPDSHGPHLAFFFKPQPLNEIVLSTIVKSPASYGFNRDLGLKNSSDESAGRKRIIVEFSSPNIAKPFHAGHLRSTIIGGFLANLYERVGWDVVRMNYLGDWGKQYGVLAVGYKKFGSDAELDKNPIGHLYDVYVEINKELKAEEEQLQQKEAHVKELQVRKSNTKKIDSTKNENVLELEQELETLRKNGIDEQARQYFKRMVDGDEEAVKTWRKFRDLSIKKYKETYARLNIYYDDYSGESQIQDASMEKAARILEGQKVSEESKGAVIVDLSRHGAKKLGKALVKKSDGTSLYLTRDIGAIMERDEKYHFDKMIYVIANQQDMHVAQLFKIVELMGLKDLASRCEHVNFGMVLGMSTRKGTVKFLDDILRDVGDYMHDVMRNNQDKYQQVEDPAKTADTLGISAVMVQDMTGKRVNNYKFEMERMTSFEGDTGPYLQYAHARLCSITRKAQMSSEELADADFTLLTEKHAREVVRALAQWPDVVQNTLKTNEPITVLTYLFKMTHALSASYDHLQVVGSELAIKKARLALYTCARQTLWNGMRLLGLDPVER